MCSSLSTPTAGSFSADGEEGSHYSLIIEGPFQGRGARPLVRRLATELGLGGAVCNYGSGLMIQVKATEVTLGVLTERLRSALGGDLAYCEERLKSAVDLVPEAQQAIAGRRFVIGSSIGGHSRIHVPLDRGICQSCSDEVEDSGTPKRYRYLLNACVNCGPRYSVLKSLPFDRERSALSDFTLCDSCRAAFADADNPRCHEQLISCRECGPAYWLENSGGDCIARDPELLLTEAVRRISQGQVLAIQGVGGFHLCCDAQQAVAVKRLRQFKQRPKKPFAIMGLPEQLKPYVEISHVAEAQLRSPARPIVILPRTNMDTVNHLVEVAPGLTRLGVMLPYTALQYLLLKRMGRPVVMTSANRSGEPLIYRHKDMSSLVAMADAMILHNRSIERPIEDSVIQVLPASGHEKALSIETAQCIRLGRGFSPLVIEHTAGNVAMQSPRVLAMGGELKNSIAVTENDARSVVISPYVGDLYQAGVYQSYQQFVPGFLKLVAVSPDAIVIDRHPDYHSSRFGRELAAQWQKPVITAQHHHAHAVAVMAEHRLPLDKKIPAIVMDGLGWGDDNSLWGGELLWCNAVESQRLATLNPFPLLGGNQASRQPWRNALGVCGFLPENLRDKLLIGFNSRFPDKQHIINACGQMAQRNEPGLLTSSAGRLFDAVAAIIGFPEYEITDEAEAAVWLQQQAEVAMMSDGVPSGKTAIQAEWFAGFSPLRTGQAGPLKINPEPFLRYLLSEVVCDKGITEKQTAKLALDFHLWLAVAFERSLTALKNAGILPDDTGQVVLSGGVMQNGLMVKLLKQSLTNKGWTVLLPQRVPANDNGLALGQAIIGHAHMTLKTGSA